MSKSLNPICPFLVLALLGALTAVASGCGTTTASVDRGRVLFVQNCGTCHQMAQAGTTAQVGPNLDDAFSAARAAGEKGSTIEGIVKAQVENPRPNNGNPTVSMPADIVSGQDLEDVAAYVGEYAGVPGGCHTLAAAKSGGVTGPDLDQVVPKLSPAEVHEAIVDPNKTIAKGYPPNVMPQDYSTTISSQEINQLVQYLIDSAGKGG